MRACRKWRACAGGSGVSRGATISPGLRRRAFSPGAAARRDGPDGRSVAALAAIFGAGTSESLGGRSVGSNGPKALSLGGRCGRMNEILFSYKRIEPTTWAYLSSLLLIALYFKFSRFWSVRNLDLVMIILLSPGLLLVKYGSDHAGLTDNAALIEHIGYIWLFSASGCLLLRLLLDASMVRRPLLEPNLSVGGLTFLGVSLCVFLMANVITGTP